jgi:hypothetical protein
MDQMLMQKWMQSEGGRNGRYWLLWTGTGADGFLVDEMEPRPKLYKKLGAVGYALQSLAIAPGISGMQAEVAVDGRSLQGFLRPGLVEQLPPVCRWPH